MSTTRVCPCLRAESGERIHSPSCGVAFVDSTGVSASWKDGELHFAATRWTYRCVPGAAVCAHVQRRAPSFAHLVELEVTS